MTTRVVVTPEAFQQTLTIDAWWRAERTAAPQLFSQELSAALDLLATAPQAGRHYPHAAVPDVRRVLLRSTRYHVYYKTHKDAVLVLAVWSAIRGSGPDLR